LINIILVSFYANEKASGLDTVIQITGKQIAGPIFGFENFYKHL